MYSQWKTPFWVLGNWDNKELRPKARSKINFIEKDNGQLSFIQRGLYMDIGEKLKLLEKTKETLDKLTDELRKRAYMKAQNERIYRMG